MPPKRAKKAPPAPIRRSARIQSREPSLETETGESVRLHTCPHVLEFPVVDNCRSSCSLRDPRARCHHIPSETIPFAAPHSGGEEDSEQALYSPTPRVHAREDPARKPRETAARRGRSGSESRSFNPSLNIRILTLCRVERKSIINTAEAAAISAFAAATRPSCYCTATTGCATRATCRWFTQSPLIVDRLFHWSIRAEAVRRRRRHTHPRQQTDAPAGAESSCRRRRRVRPAYASTLEQTQAYGRAS